MLNVKSPRLSYDPAVAETLAADCRSYTRALVNRAVREPVRMADSTLRANRSSCFMPVVGHATYNRGSCTRSSNTIRISIVIFGGAAGGRVIALPRGKSPKYLATHVFACAGSKSPTIASVAFVGA